METVPRPDTSRQRIVCQRHGEIVVVQPLGALDQVLAGDVREQILEAHAPVVIDLDRCAHFEARAIHDIVTSWPLYRPRFCFACSSAGDRRMMQRLTAEADIQLFPSVGEALAALLDADR